MPVLCTRHQRRFLVQRPHAQSKKASLSIGRPRIDRCPTCRTKSQYASITTFRSFHIGLRLTGQKCEPFIDHRNIHTKCRTRKHLAVSAVTNLDQIFVDFCCPTEISAKTLTIDLHLPPPTRREPEIAISTLPDNVPRCGNCIYSSSPYQRRRSTAVITSIRCNVIARRTPAARHPPSDQSVADACNG